MYPEFEDFDDEHTLVWDDETKTVSLNLRLKTATALVALGLLVATPAQAQVVVGRTGSGPDVEVAAPPRNNLPPEWLRHIPPATGGKPYQPNRARPAGVTGKAAGDVAAIYTAPKPLPVSPSKVPAATAGLRAPQLNGQRAVSGIDSYDLPQAGHAKKETAAHLMAAPWSPRAQHIDCPLFPELQPKPEPVAPTSTRHGAVLAAPQLGGAKPVVTREASTLPPVLTPDLMSSLQQAARDEEAGLPPPVPRDEGNGVNASSAQDRTQTLGTIEHSRVDAIVAAREGRAVSEPGPSAGSRRLFSSDDGAPRDAPPAPRNRDDVPLPPSPVPTPAPSTMGYLTPPRGRDDEITVPDKPYSDSLAPLDKPDDSPGEVTVRLDDEPAPDAGKRRVLGRIGDKQKPTVYNAPVPVPVPVPQSDADTAPAVVDAAPVEDDKAFKAEGRKLFTAPKKKSKKPATAKAPGEQMSLFEAAQAKGAKAVDGSTIVKVPTAVPDAGEKTILTITPEGAEESPRDRVLESPAVAAVDTKPAAAIDGAKEIKEVPVNPTPFGDKVIGTISANETVDTAPAAALGAGDGPDITLTADAPKVLGKGPRKMAAKKASAVTDAAVDNIAVPPKPVEPATRPADDEIRVMVDDAPAPVAAPGPEPQSMPKNVLRAPSRKPVMEPYVPPKQALRKEYRPPEPQPESLAPTSLAPLADQPAVTAGVTPRAAEVQMPAPRTATPAAPQVVQEQMPAPRSVVQEQMYVQTPAVQQGERPRLRTPKLLLGSDLPAVAAPTPAAPSTPVAEIVADETAPATATLEPAIIERPALTPPPEPEIAPTIIAPPPAAIELRMPTITFGPTDRDLDYDGEAQAQLLAEQLSLNPDRRVTLIAYAQAPNLNEARRVALSRALAIRSRLAEHGIQPIRVSIRALGALPPGDRGTPDRVDTIVQ